MIRRITILTAAALFCCAILAAPAFANKVPTYETGILKPIDSNTHLKPGMKAPDFDLPSIDGKRVRLSDYRGKKNVIISFVPAAWTPVCSDQWPGYNIALEMFEAYDAIVLGITVDNLPTLWSWVRAMGGLKFPVLSDFFPHGATAIKYGILRNDGVAERALFIVDKKGVIHWVKVNDINKRPDLGLIVKALQNLK